MGELHSICKCITNEEMKWLAVVILVVVVVVVVVVTRLMGAGPLSWERLPYMTSPLTTMGSMEWSYL